MIMEHESAVRCTAIALKSEGANGLYLQKLHVYISGTTADLRGISDEPCAVLDTDDYKNR